MDGISNYIKGLYMKNLPSTHPRVVLPLVFLKADHQVEYMGMSIRFFWFDDRYWVAAVDLWKALGYSHSVSDTTKLLPVINKKLDISAHRKLICAPRKTWVYDFNGFEFGFWPRLRLHSTSKAELKPLVLGVLRRKSKNG